MRLFDTLVLAPIMTLPLVLGACQPTEGALKSAASDQAEQSTSPGQTAKTVRQALKPVPMSKDDSFTNSNYDKVRMTHLSLDLDVNFDKKILDGWAIIDFQTVDPAAFHLKLDSKDLEIDEILGLDRNGKWVGLTYSKRGDDKITGTMIDIPFSKGMNKIKIRYRTSPSAEGLQWLSPAQTKDGKFPYLFSQNETIFARTMAPLQDTPAVRITYDATLRVPDGMRALMSAEQLGQDKSGQWHFKMPQPIPAYLIAIAVGEIEYKPIDKTTGVYAEPYILDKARAEFTDTPDMERVTSELYGPYRWGQYDMLILPPSFPFGGMENPRLTFLTPTLVVGDKSLVDVVAHELAHSWSGNLVTNSNWRDAWLNEGFTTYVENRVMGKLHGQTRADMEKVLALAGLKRDIKGAERPEMTWLKLPADMHHPDDAFSNVAYVKGMFFLNFLEQRFGRDSFDPFLKSYFNHFAFQSISTEDFLAYLKANLMDKYPGKVTEDEIKAWVYGPGLPETFIPPQSEAFKKVEAQYHIWDKNGIKASALETKDWTTQEWLHFINGLGRNYKADKYKELDDAFHFSGAPNAEIAFAWYMKTIKGGYNPAKPELRKFLLSVGRGKFIYRLYDALANHNAEDLAWAKKVYAEARPGYHPIAQRRIDAIFAKAEGK